MKCTVSASSPNILLEAQLGDLFLPIGSKLVECVCAVRSIAAGGRERAEIDVRESALLDPDVVTPVVVIACRVQPDDPEYRPAGYETYLVNATPIVFLEQVEPAAFRERAARRRDDSAHWRVEIRGGVPASCQVRPDNAVDGVCVGGFTSPAQTLDPQGVPISRL